MTCSATMVQLRSGQLQTGMPARRAASRSMSCVMRPSRWISRRPRAFSIAAALTTPSRSVIRTSNPGRRSASCSGVGRDRISMSRSAGATSSAFC